MNYAALLNACMFGIENTFCEYLERKLQIETSKMVSQSKHEIDKDCKSSGRQKYWEIKSKIKKKWKNGLIELAGHSLLVQTS